MGQSARKRKAPYEELGELLHDDTGSANALVTVNLQDLSSATSQSLTVPKALICSTSKYLDEIFNELGDEDVKIHTSTETFTIYLDYCNNKKILAPLPTSPDGWNELVLKLMNAYELGQELEDVEFLNLVLKALVALCNHAIDKVGTSDRTWALPSSEVLQKIEECFYDSDGERIRVLMIDFFLSLKLSDILDHSDLFDAAPEELLRELACRLYQEREAVTGVPLDSQKYLLLPVSGRLPSPAYRPRQRPSVQHPGTDKKGADSCVPRG